MFWNELPVDLKLKRNDKILVEELYEFHKKIVDDNYSSWKSIN